MSNSLMNKEVFDEIQRYIDNEMSFMIGVPNSSVYFKPNRANETESGYTFSYSVDGNRIAVAEFGDDDPISIYCNR